MMTPKEKYMNDVQYRVLVDTLLAHIEKCLYTPSEMREAAILACILYEEKTALKTGYMFNEEGERIGKEKV